MTLQFSNYYDDIFSDKGISVSNFLNQCSRQFISINAICESAFAVDGYLHITFVGNKDGLFSVEYDIDDHLDYFRDLVDLQFLAVRGKYHLSRMGNVVTF